MGLFKMDSSILPGKDDLVESFELDEIGQLLKEDKVEEIKSKGKYLTQQHSEICAYYGSNKCLEYMTSEGMTISPLINLYAIKQNQKLTISIPHDDELHMLITQGNLDAISKLAPPPVNIVVDTFYDLSEEFGLPLDEALKLVRAKIDNTQWNSMSQESIVKMIEINKPEYLTECNIHLKTFRKIIQAGLLDICSRAGHAYTTAMAELEGNEKAKQRK